VKIYSSEISGSLKVRGDIFAENYVVKSTVSTITQSFSSGSTIFGDSNDDTHRFTGSLFISASRIDLDDSKNNIAIGKNSISVIGAGQGGNVAVGYESMKSAGTAANNNAEFNTAIGYESLKDVTTGYTNVAVGKGAGESLTTGHSNVAIGTGALDVATDVDNTVIIGKKAGEANMTSAADGTISIGYSAGAAITSGASNIAIGYEALKTTTTGLRNIAIGYEAMHDTDAGSSSSDSDNNIFIGYTAGGGAWADAKSENNVAIGSNVMQGVLNGANNNTALGYFALASITSGDTNVGIGAEAGGTLTVGIKNVMMGYQAGNLVNHANADENVLIGYAAGKGGTGEMKRCIVIGSQAMDSTTDQAQTGTIAIGHAALSALTSGTGNTAVGYSAGGAITNSSQNTFLGYASGDTNIGDHSVAVGYHALKGVSGNANSYNTAVGSRAMDSVTTGGSNVAVGFDSLGAITTATGNTAIGYNAGDTITTSGYNALVGYEVGQALAGGSGQNVAIGYQPLYNGTSNTRVIAIGSRAGYNSTADNNVYIGYSAGRESRAGVSQVYIGNQAGYYATGSYNTFVGDDAGKGGTTSAPFSSGQYNTAVGRQALGGFTTGGSNTAVGYTAGNAVTTGTENTFLGFHAGYNATGTNSYAVLIGSYAGYQNNNGSVVYIGRYAGYAGSGHIGGGNIAIGYHALFTNRSTDEEGCKWNIAIGRGAMNNATDTLGAAHSNVAIGYTALKNIESGSRNIAIGGQQGGGDGGTGEFLKNGDYNVFVGSKAGQGIDSGNIHSDKNVFLGASAGAGHNGAEGNVGIGYLALTFARGDYSVAIGRSAGDHATGSYNTFVGGYAGQGGTTSAPYSSGQNNVAVGYQALDGFTTGYSNVAVGRIALGGVGTGFRNVGIGDGAGQSLTTGNENVAVGYNALKLAGTTSNQVAIGKNALHSVQTGTGNTGLGYNTLYQNSSGNNNVAIGYNAGFFGSAKTENVLIGLYAGYNATGSFNTFVGSQAGKGGTTSAPYSSGQNNVAMGYEALKSFTTAQRMVAIGYEAMTDVKDGQDSVAIGYQAAYYNSSSYSVSIGKGAGMVMGGGYNVSVGFGAGGSASDSNVAIGQRAMGLQPAANENVAVGSVAGSNLIGGFTAIVGAQAGRHATGSYNTFMGYKAGYGSITSAPFSSGENNTALGYNALKAFTTAASNTVIGYSAGSSITTGGANILIGSQAGMNITTTTSNVVIGNNAGQHLGGSNADNHANRNVIIGHSAAKGSSPSIAKGHYSVVIGDQAQYHFKSGSQNVYMGYQSSYYNQNGNYNVTIGSGAGSNATGSSNTFVGYRSGKGGNSSAPYSSGGNNTAFGYETLTAFTTGESNVAVGREAGHDITTGTGNTLVGNAAGDKITTAEYNTAIGAGALGSQAADADGNIAIGDFAMGAVNNAASIENVAVGGYAGSGGTGQLIRTVAIGKNALNSTGTANLTGTVAIGYNAGTAINHAAALSSTLVGYLCGDSITSGAGNSAFGYEALTAQSVNGWNAAFGNYSAHAHTGAYSTFLGTKAGENLTSGNNAIHIGFNTAASAVDVDSEYVIGAGTSFSDGLTGGGTETIRIGVSTDYITNDFGENATWTHSSDRRVKKNIEDNDLGLGFIEKLRTRKFQKKAPSEYPEEFEQHNSDTTERKNPDRIHYGFVAQEVKEAMDSVGHSEFPVWKENRDGMQELGETELITPLVKAVQELSLENKELKDELNELKILIKKKLGDE